jgi:hypothetical protein
LYERSFLFSTSWIKLNNPRYVCTNICSHGIDFLYQFIRGILLHYSLRKFRGRWFCTEKINDKLTLGSRNVKISQNIANKLIQLISHILTFAIFQKLISCVLRNNVVWKPHGVNITHLIFFQSFSYVPTYFKHYYLSSRSLEVENVSQKL